MSVFSYLKLFAASISAFILAVFGIKYNRYKVKSETLADSIENEKKNAKTQDMVHNDEIKSKEMDLKIEKTTNTISNDTKDKKTKLVNQVDNTPEGVPYKVEV